MALSLTSVTVNSGPKLDLTAATWAMSTFAEEVFGAEEQPASRHMEAIANTVLAIGANLPNADGQLRNMATVLTSRSAANCGGNDGCADPGSVVSVVKA